MAEAEVDPRYAAQFQRGYDPTRDAAPARRGPVRLEGGPPPTAPRVPDPPAVVERRPAATAPVAAASDEPLATARSRLEWALLGVGVAMLVAAVALFVGAVQQTDRYSGWSADFPGYLWDAATDQLPGPLLVAGVLAIVAWIVLRAVSAERRSR
jgi:hypothetical protein